MAKKPSKPFRLPPLQRVTVRPIEDPVEQALLDERLRQCEEAAAGARAAERPADKTTLGKRAQDTARRARQPLGMDLKAVIETMGLDWVIEQAGVKQVIEHLGPKRVFAELGAKWVIDELGGVDRLWEELTPEQRRQLKRLARE